MAATQTVLPPIESPPPLDIPALGSGSPVHSPEPTPRPPRPAHSNVLARLQALFPSAAHPQPSPVGPPATSHPPVQDPPKCIKVRILTWNMHDSLPKGNVEDLLGSVPLSNPDLPSGDVFTPSLPAFPATPDHPYHIVIVAGQECPSASGIPMALGAGFKLNNKDKDNSRSKHSLLPPDADESVHRKSAETDPQSPSEKPHEHHHPPSSWSSVLENWYCHPPVAYPIASDPNLKTQHETQRVGPYELLAKERMMGLYLAVFIHRQAKPLVRGVSKSAVTTGLIGGRVGNKGGVGVSMNLAGTTLLFINAHLAAHEGRVQHRLADLAKIKAELSVDDFLTPEDPRFMAEDITDRFDFTFIFGDLNFRLDVTRLHADWLISRKDYEQALEFDQLRKVMATCNAFAGFQEAPIRFPPTFKYDVYKRSRHRSFKRPPTKPISAVRHEKLLSEVAEQEPEGTNVLDDRASPHEHNVDEEGEPDGDAASVASSAWTSVRSRRTTDPDGDDYVENSPPSAGFVSQSAPTSASTTNVMHKMWSAAAAHKAKEKWVALWSTAAGTNSPGDKKRHKWRQSWTSVKSLTPSRRGSQNTTEEMPPQPQIDLADPRQNQASRIKEFQAVLFDAANARPHLHLALSENNVDLEEEEERGVYDSSHKQRVPSWQVFFTKDGLSIELIAAIHRCDRILWKSTIKPESESDTEDGESQRFMPLRAKMGQFFHALRPSSLRSRRDSTWSLHHLELSQHPSGEQTPQPPQPPQLQPRPSLDTRHSSASSVPSPTRTKIYPPQRLSHVRSADSLPKSSDEHALARAQSHDEPSKTHASMARAGVPMRLTNTISPVLTLGNGTATALARESEGHASPLDIARAPNSSPPVGGPVFRWLLPFLYRDGSQPTVVQPSADTPATPPPAPPRPRRGDVVCLQYDTLDDRAMRRLEGRSDHRPVIGSYALYV
ncbi:DNase I-like protein [Trametes punicea]|nr:DNase I-like protein [Trametes punicea]